MKHLGTLVFSILLICCNAVSYSQKFTAGFYSGINLSDLHGQGIGGKWSYKPGPVQGLNLGYSINKTIGLETGLNFSTTYYEHKPSLFPPVYYPIYYYPANIAPNYNYYGENVTMDFRFLRIPLLIQVTLPLEFQFKMRGGIFFSHLMDYSIKDNSYYYPYEQEKPVKNDFGYMFSSGISYPLGNNLKATFDIGYIAGKKKFIEDMLYRHGSSEYTFGISYNGFGRDKDKIYNDINKNDSSSHNISLAFKGGISYSWIQPLNDETNSYGYSGPSVGFYLKIPFGQGMDFQTGLTFERKGYSLKDSSATYYRIVKNEIQNYYMDSRVQLDYAIIPAIISIPVGRAEKVFITTGPWLGFKLNARAVGTAYYDYHSYSNYQLKKIILYEDFEKPVKDYDAGWMFGLGMSLPIVKAYKVDIAIQYSSGFRDVFDKSGIDDITNTWDNKFKIRNRTISLFLGFVIPSVRN